MEAQEVKVILYLTENHVDPQIHCLKVFNMN